MRINRKENGVEHPNSLPTEVWNSEWYPKYTNMLSKITRGSTLPIFGRDYNRKQLWATDVMIALSTFLREAQDESGSS